MGEIVLIALTGNLSCSVENQQTNWISTQMGDKLKGKNDGSAMLCGRLFCWNGLGLLVPLMGSVTANQYKALLTDHLYPMRQHICLDAVEWSLPG